MAADVEENRDFVEKTSRSFASKPSFMSRGSFVNRDTVTSTAAKATDTEPVDSQQRDQYQINPMVASQERESNVTKSFAAAAETERDAEAKDITKV
jgi:hypothetical protein